MQKYIMTIAMLLISVVASAQVTDLSQTDFLAKAADKQTVVLDIRTPREYAAGHIQGAINIPHADILKDAAVLEPYANKDLVFYCHTGGRVKRVTDFLRSGKHVDDNRLFHLKGDMRAWRGSQRPVVTQ